MIEKTRLAWFILLRMVVVSIFMASIVILFIKEPASFNDATLPELFRLIIATYLFSTVSLFVLRFTNKYQNILTYSQIIWDLTLVTILILLTGGINSLFSFLYILSIINASVLLSRREAVYTASLCAILYGAILDFQFYGQLNSIGLIPQSDLQHGANYVLFTIFTNILAFYLTAFLTGYLAERAARSENALLKKEIDYQELERLNGAIVSNLDSGLVTLNRDGRIRVFNRYASELTGISMEDAYDLKLSEIVSGIPAPEESNPGFRQGEIEYAGPTGSIMILDYKMVPLSDLGGKHVGVIVAFQDITTLKKMETQLKKADRLAAIGELSARIAHEIRNPLASISGSVQLIALGERIDVKDMKLLDIVLRETDRLNDLIRDFLAYARPTQPLKIPILLKRFLTDLAELLTTDPLFDKITIDNNYPDDLVIVVDRDQFQQVFWNLMINAADAMPDGGNIKVRASVHPDGIPGRFQRNTTKITVSDNGRGMELGNLDKVFEPFFTTKTGGTGLGLATVYRIVESHDGSILVDSTRGVGTTFTIFLPDPAKG
jgi:two-component system, NtrC family, sensor histidine kinase PilS